MHNKFTATVAILIGMGIWLLAFWMGMHSACNAYYITPDIADFEHFAIPSYSGHQGKFMFLFGPSVVALIAGIAFLSAKTRWLEKTRRFHLYLLSPFPLRVVLTAFAAILFLLVTYDHSNRALTMASQIHWGGSLPSNRLVDSLCLPFGLPYFFVQIGLKD